MFGRRPGIEPQTTGTGTPFITAWLAMVWREGEHDPLEDQQTARRR